MEAKLRQVESEVKASLRRLGFVPPVQIAMRIHPVQAGPDRWMAWELSCDVDPEIPEWLQEAIEPVVDEILQAQGVDYLEVSYGDTGVSWSGSYDHVDGEGPS